MALPPGIFDPFISSWLQDSSTYLSQQQYDYLRQQMAASSSGYLGQAPRDSRLVPEWELKKEAEKCVAEAARKAEKRLREKSDAIWLDDLEADSTAPKVRPLPEPNPDPFTMLCNHSFHVLLDEFEGLLKGFENG